MGQEAERELLQSKPAKQPNSKHCFGCGVDNANGLAMAFYEVGPGHVACEITVPEHFQGYPGVVHGGVVATMLDEIANRAALIGDHSRMTMTAKLTTRYRKPVPVGELLKIEGWLERDRGRFVMAKGEIRLADGSLAAEAEATLSTIEGSNMDLGRLVSEGWMVYPD
jgi:acyl-coenzyme A thioesterase PaaI-like protein